VKTVKDKRLQIHFFFDMPRRVLGFLLGFLTGCLFVAGSVMLVGGIITHTLPSLVAGATVLAESVFPMVFHFACRASQGTMGQDEEKQQKKVVHPQGYQCYSALEDSSARV
jgi:hypothetical protein